MSTSRNSRITLVSAVGIGANVLIAGTKVVVGLLANSVAVLMDAVNNLSDAMSSAITIIGVKLAGRKPDAKHPFGYGRIEYFSAIIISGIIFAAGASSLVESVKAIFHPETTDFSWVSVIVIVVALLAKVVLGRYFRLRGKALNSDALVASGIEATYDAVLSASTLLAAGVSMIWGISIDGYIGALISLFIIKTGIEMLLDPLGKVVGNRLQGDLSVAIKQRVKEVPGVLGVYDLVLHDYGPDRAMGSLHIEVSDSMSARDVHKVCRRVAALVYTEFKALVTVGIYASNDTDPEILAMQDKVRDLAMAHKGVKQIHGFFVDGNMIAFDIVIAFNHDAAAICRDLAEEVSQAYPGHRAAINVDTDYSD